MNDQAIRRVRHLARVLYLLAALIVGRLVQLQIVQHSEYKLHAQKQQERVLKIQAERGQILDRDGQPLAVSRPLDSVCVNPVLLRDMPFAADVLSKVLQIDGPTLLQQMRDAADDDHGFLWVKRRITPEESQSLHALNFDWIEYRTEYQRVYPEHSLAAHVIGSVDFDQQGNAGIEQIMDDELQGHDGKMLLATDVHRDGFDSQLADQPRQGRTVRLTIDTRIQRIAERELMRTVLKHQCKSGSIIVLDPRTGDILAMASYPTFDPNDPVKRGQDMGPRENHATMVPFEPGSVFKVVTLSTALETTELQPGSPINCGMGSITVGKRTVHEDHKYGTLSMEDVLVHSSNVGAIRVGRTIGPTKLYEYMTQHFQLGKRSGLPLPGESAGMVHKLKKWTADSMLSIPMGHEVMVTTLQLAQICGIVANNGFYIKPRITLDMPVSRPLAVLRPETAITMRRMMESVVLRGTGRNARLQEYTAGGKTGTAQIANPGAHQYTHFYNASFMGFAPVTNPRLVVVVTANGASGKSGYGAGVSAPVFKEVASAALRLRDVPPDLPEDMRMADNGQVETDAIAQGPAPDLDPDDGPAGLAPGTTAPPSASPEVERPVANKKKAVFRGRAARHDAKNTVQAVSQK
jgi:cell division protein FtsI (penicillin-binding protein 3)